MKIKVSRFSTLLVCFYFWSVVIAQKSGGSVETDVRRSTDQQTFTKDQCL